MKLICSLMAGLLSCVFAIRCAAQSYIVTDLGTLGGTSSSADGINNNGQVVGRSLYNNLNDGRAFLWSDGIMNPLGTLAGAAGINDGGEIVGNALTLNDPAAPLHAFVRSSSGSMTDLGTLGGRNSYAGGINDSGQVAGESDISNGSRAFFWSGGSMTNLGTLGGTYSSAKALNNSGQVVGQAYDSSGRQRAFLWSGGNMTDLGTLGGTNSYAAAINSAGQVAGWADTTNNTASHAFLWSGGNMTDLGTLGTYAEPRGINDSGQVVGRSDDRAFLYSAGVLRDLNTKVVNGSGWSLETANAINNAGQIVGTGTHDGQGRAFLLTSIQKNAHDYVPPPQTPPNMQAEINNRIGKWNGSEFVPLGANDVAQNQKVYVIAHGWGPGMKSVMDANPGAKAWEVHIDNDPSKPLWGQWMEDQAAAIHNTDPTAIVLGYSWLDHSATADIHQSDISRREADWAGYRLGNILNVALGLSYSGEVDLVGHSHGARVVSDAALLLNRGHAGRLTLLDSPDRTDLEADAAVGLIVGEGRNYLDDVLNKLESRNGGNGIGNGVGQIFVENYYSNTGRAYRENGMVNARLQGNAQQQDVFSLHGYPYRWYSGTGYAGQNGGLEWQSGTLPPQHYWKQDWWTDTGLVDQNGHTVFADDPTREYNLVVDQASEERYYSRTPKMVIYNREGSVAGSTPEAILKMEEHSPAYADFTLLTSPGDSFLTFDYQFENPGDGDQLGIWINDELKFIIAGWDAPSGLQGGAIDIGDLQPGIQLVTVALHNYGQPNAVIDVGDFRIVSTVPEPGVLSVCILGFLSVIYPHRSRLRHPRGAH